MKSYKIFVEMILSIIKQQKKAVKIIDFAKHKDQILSSKWPSKNA
jgi:hypothetical protein